MWGSIPDWVAALSNIATAITAVVAAVIGLRSFKSQRTSADIALALDIFIEINRYWDRITDKNGESFDYEIGQILAQFEVSAALFNSKILTKDAMPVLSDHIIESFCAIRDGEGGKQLIDQCRSSESTFNELQAFLRDHAPTALVAMKWQEKEPRSTSDRNNRI